MAQNSNYTAYMKAISDQKKKSKRPKQRSLNEKLFGNAKVDNTGNPRRQNGSQVGKNGLIRQRENYSQKLADSYQRDVDQAQQAQPYLNLPNAKGPQEGFQPYETNARANHQQGLSTIASKFADFGNSSNSSSILQALGQSTGDFERDLAAQKSQYGLNNEQAQANNFFRLKNPSQQALQGQYTNDYDDNQGPPPGSGGGGNSRLLDLLQLGATGAAGIIGGPGAAAGTHAVGGYVKDWIQGKYTNPTDQYTGEQIGQFAQKGADRFRNFIGTQNSSSPNSSPYDPNGPKLADRFNYIPH